MRTHRPARLLAALAVLGSAVALAPLPAAAQYPERPITLIVPWAAGGGTDATARIIASGLEQELGQPINVVNRTGGSGVVGHQAIASAEPDGYTIGIATVEIGMMHHQGLTELTWADYTPIALVNQDPAGVQVSADAPYADLNALLDDIRARPGALKASGTGQGGIWHLALAGMLNDLGIDPAAVPWVPSEGAAPGLQDLVAGGVDIVPSSIPEARSLMDAGRVKSLAIMAAERSATFPDVPTLQEVTGSDWTMGAWRGIVGPKGLPQEVVDRLVAAVQAVHQGQEFQDFMNQRGFGMIYLGPDEFTNFMAESDENLGSVMQAVGLAQ